MLLSDVRGRRVRQGARAQSLTTDATDDVSSWVLDVLEPGQLTAEKRAHRLGKRSFGPGIVALLWMLRVYVVVMLLLVAGQIWVAIN